MSVVFRESAERALLSSLDVGLLSVRDRACLRLLYRAGVATADQLATLIFPSRRTALRRLRRLWQLGLLERAPLAPERGGIPVVYRLSRRGSKRLGYVDTRTGGVSRVRHTLDIVDAVCALVRSAPGSVQLWLTEPMTDGVLPADVRPDSVVVVQLGGGSAVLCLEIDEATEHSPTIRARLGAYERALAGRDGWHLVWVVPTEERLGWLRRVARWDQRPGLERLLVGPRPRRAPRGWAEGANAARRLERRGGVAGSGHRRPASRVGARRPSARPDGSACSARRRRRDRRGAGMSRDRLTPAERTLRARMGAYVVHARYDPRQTTAPARAAFMKRFLDEVDPDRVLPEPERLRRAASARKAYFTRLAFLASRRRRQRKSRGQGR